VAEANGQLTVLECELLFTLAKNVTRGQSVVWSGNSEDVRWLTKGFDSSQVEKVIFVNLSENDIAKNIYNPGIDNEQICVLAPERITDVKVKAFRTSDEASRRCTEKIGLLLISNSHFYDDIKRILQAWLPKLAQDAKVAFFRCDLLALALVLEEYLGDLGDFTFFKSIGVITIVDIDKCVHFWLIDSQDFGTCKVCRRRRNFKRIRNGFQWVENSEKQKAPLNEIPVKSRKCVIQRGKGWSVKQRGQNPNIK
jgi:hypothetical protein